MTGINDALGVPTVPGFRGTCHDSPNVGNHSVKLPINIGIANAGPFNAATGTGAVPALNIGDMPVFTHEVAIEATRSRPIEAVRNHTGIRTMI